MTAGHITPAGFGIITGTTTDITELGPQSFAEIKKGSPRPPFLFPKLFREELWESYLMNSVSRSWSRPTKDLLVR